MQSLCSDILVKLVYLATIKHLVQYVYEYFTFFLSHSGGGLAGEFQIIVLLHNPSEIEVTNWRPDNLLRDFLSAEFIVPSIMASRPGPEAAKHP